MVIISLVLLEGLNLNPSISALKKEYFWQVLYQQIPCKFVDIRDTLSKQFILSIYEFCGLFCALCTIYYG